MKVEEVVEGHAPKRNRAGDAAFDVKSNVAVVIPPGETSTVGLGFKVELPEGHCALIIERSGHASKSGIRCIGPLIDPNYRGEVHAIIHNAGSGEFVVRRGDRVAQMLVLRFFDGDPIKGSLETDTARGGLGLGSSGDS